MEIVQWRTLRAPENVKNFKIYLLLFFFLLFFIVKIYFVWKEQKNEATKKKSDFAVQVVV